MYEQAIELAINELLSPQFEATKQILSVHDLILEAGRPIIKRVDKTSYPDWYFIYFPLLEEDYFLVIPIQHTQDGLMLFLAYIEANVQVYLAIWSSDLTPEDISSELKLTPTEIRRKGDTDSGLPRKYKEHAWFYEPQKDIPDSLERKIAFLLDKIEPSCDKIVQLGQKVTVKINICYMGYTELLGGWYLNSAILKKLAALNCGVDFDLYAFGPKLPD